MFIEKGHYNLALRRVATKLGYVVWSLRDVNFVENMMGYKHWVATRRFR